MLDDKYFTTPLLLPSERPALEEKPIRKPPLLRLFWIGGKLLLLILGFLRSKNAGPQVQKEHAVRIRQFLEKLGGMWIKLGQVLAMRTDIFSIEFCTELVRLQDRSITFSSKRSAEIIEENIARPINEVFDDFEPEPFAAASLSQVHRARCKKTQARVVIKVQRPFAAEYFHYDFRWLKVFFHLFSYFDIMRTFRFDEMLKEIQLMIEEELDYRQEASNMIRLRKTLKAHKIYVPKVFYEYSTKVILTMEYLDGVFMSDYISVRRTDPGKAEDWLDKNNIDTRIVARRLLQSALRQLYEDYIFHGDLHPGNIILLRKNRIALIDFGNVGRVDPRFATQYQQYFKAMSEEEIDRATDLLLITMGQLPVLDVAALKKRVNQVLERQVMRSHIRNLPYHEKSMSSNSAELNQVMSAYRIEVNWNMLKMARTFETVDQNIGILNPEFNFVKELHKYKEKAVKRKRCKTQQQLPGILESLSDMSGIIMPLILNNALQFSGRIKYGARLLSYLFRLLRLGGVVALFVAIWVYLYQHHPHLVAEYHADENLFTTWVESVIEVHKFAWYLFIAILIGVTLRFKKFAAELIKPPVRLPGDRN